MTRRWAIVGFVGSAIAFLWILVAPDADSTMPTVVQAAIAAASESIRSEISPTGFLLVDYRVERLSRSEASHEVWVYVQPDVATPSKGLRGSRRDAEIQASRLRARTGPGGEIVTLDKQDRARWD